MLRYYLRENINLLSTRAPWTDMRTKQGNTIYEQGMLGHPGTCMEKVCPRLSLSLALPGEGFSFQKILMNTQSPLSVNTLACQRLVCSLHLWGPLVLHLQPLEQSLG